MRRIITLVLSLTSALTFSQAPEFEWVNFYDDSRANDVYETSSLEVYTVGKNGDLNGRDCFIRKHDASGTLLWEIEITNSSFIGYAEGFFIHVDEENDEFVVSGTFEGEVDFDPSANDFEIDAGENRDVFLVKYSTEGEFIWAKSITGDEASTVGGMAVSSTDQIVLGGRFLGTVDFDPNAGEQLLTSEGGLSSFVLILDQDGNYVNASTLNTPDDSGTFSRVDHLKIDGDDNIVVVGDFSGTVDFDSSPDSEANLENQPFNDFCILKIDMDFNYIWVRQLVGFSLSIRTIEVNQDGTVLVAGVISQDDLFLFDPAGNEDLLINLDPLSSNSDGYFLKLNENGSSAWSRLLEVSNGSDACIPSGITVDNLGDIYITGRLSGTADFDPTSQTLLLSTTDDDERVIFCAKYTVSGQVNFAFFAQNTVVIAAGDIFVGPTGNIVMAGGDMGATGSLDFDPGPGNSNSSISVAGVSYLWKIDQCFPVINSVDIVECDSYESQGSGITYTNSGSFEESYQTPEGCDSTLVLNITILESTSIEQNESACESFTWDENGVVYTGSGLYDVILQNSVGCDSIVTLNLVINEAADIVETISACESFVWDVTGESLSESNTYVEEFTSTQGCDSTRTLVLTILEESSSTIEVSACDEYETPSGGETYTESGTYQDVILNESGCDSLITIELEISLSSMGEMITAEECFSYTSPSGVEYTESGEFTEVFVNAAGCDSIVPLDITINTVNSSIIAIDNFLEAEESGATYQWLDCNDNFSPIAGATEQGFQPLENGSYAVEVSNAFCTDTSDCEVIFDLSVVSNSFDQKIGLYPNPSAGEVFFGLKQPINDAEVRIYTIRGELVGSYSGVLNNAVALPFDEGLKGTFIVELSSEGKKAVLRATRL